MAADEFQRQEFDLAFGHVKETGDDLIAMSTGHLAVLERAIAEWRVNEGAGSLLEEFPNRLMRRQLDAQTSAREPRRR